MGPKPKSSQLIDKVFSPESHHFCMLLLKILKNHVHIHVSRLGEFSHLVMRHSLGRRRTHMMFALIKVLHYQKQLLCHHFFSLWLIWPRGWLFIVALIISVFSILTQIIFWLSFKLAFHSAWVICTHQGLRSVG